MSSIAVEACRNKKKPISSQLPLFPGKRHNFTMLKVVWMQSHLGKVLWFRCPKCYLAGLATSNKCKNYPCQNTGHWDLFKNSVHPYTLSTWAWSMPSMNSAGTDKETLLYLTGKGTENGCFALQRLFSVGFRCPWTLRWSLDFFSRRAQKISCSGDRDLAEAW